MVLWCIYSIITLNMIFNYLSTLSLTINYAYYIVANIGIIIMYIQDPALPRLAYMSLSSFNFFSEIFGYNIISYYIYTNITMGIVVFVQLLWIISRWHKYRIHISTYTYMVYGCILNLRVMFSTNYLKK